MELPEDTGLSVKFDIFGNLLKTPDIKLDEKMFCSDLRTKDTEEDNTEDDKENQTKEKVSQFTPNAKKKSIEPKSTNLTKRSPQQDITIKLLKKKKLDIDDVNETKKSNNIKVKIEGELANFR